MWNALIFTLIFLQLFKYSEFVGGFKLIARWILEMAKLHKQPVQTGEWTRIDANLLFVAQRDRLIRVEYLSKKSDAYLKCLYFMNVQRQKEKWERLEQYLNMCENVRQKFASGSVWTKALQHFLKATKERQDAFSTLSVLAQMWPFSIHPLSL